MRPVTSSEGQGDTQRRCFRHTYKASVDDSQLVTLQLTESGGHIRFQVDTGAQCNVVPLGVYKKATKDAALVNISPSQM